MKELRGYQQQAFWSNKKLRRYMLAWLRQGGKTTTLADQALLEMGEYKSRLITFVSASLNIGSEFVEKEAKSWSDMMSEFRKWAEARKLRISAGELHTENADSWKEMPANVDWEAIAGALERSKFEIRLWHSNTICSRTKVIAPNLATCRSWSGSVKFDEVAFVAYLRDMLAELEPIFSTDPTFSFVMATTPPPDYAHYAYELLTPDDGRDEWDTKPEGNWFKNRAGMWVHRVSIDDAAAAGRKIFHPESGKEQTPDEARETSLDKDGWDRSNRLKRPVVGTSAISPVALDIAMRKGIHICSAREWEPPANWALKIGNGPIAIGIDPATTEGKKSNPTSVAVVEQVGLDYVARLITWYKIADPAEARRRVVQILDELVLAGKRNQLRGLRVDATNEKYWSRDLKAEVGHYCPVTLVSGSESIEYMGEKMSSKLYSGSLLSHAAEAGYLILPWDKYVKDDFSRPAKAPGTFICVVGPNGEHGDTFDATKQAIAELQGGGPVILAPIAVGTWGRENSDNKHPEWYQPQTPSLRA